MDKLIKQIASLKAQLQAPPASAPAGTPVRALAVAPEQPAPPRAKPRPNSKLANYRDFVLTPAMRNCSNCNERHLDRDCPNRPPPEPLRALRPPRPAPAPWTPPRCGAATRRRRPEGNSSRSTCRRDSLTAARPGAGSQQARPGAHHTALRSRARPRAGAIRPPLWHRAHREQMDIATGDGWRGRCERLLGPAGKRLQTRALRETGVHHSIRPNLLYVRR